MGLGLSWLVGCAEPASAPAAGDAIPPRAPADPMPATPEEPLEVEPQILAYGTPAIEEARVVRKGPKAQIRLRWGKVAGAKKYEVQVSKALTFSRATAGASTPKLIFASRWLEPSVYFWRVRAAGDAGLGAWTDVQVLDATRTGSRGKRVARPAEPMEPVEPPPPVVDNNAPPLRLVWRKPQHQAIVTSNPVTLEGVATRGTTVEIAGVPPVTVEAAFAIVVKLTHGRNDLVLVGKLGDQVKRIERSIYYADPAKLEPIRTRFEAVKRQLEEIGAIRDELNDTIRSLEARMKKAPEEAGMAEMKAEVERITQIRKEIDGEVGKAIKELDALLGG
jgi:hypothetical protein